MTSKVNVIALVLDDKEWASRLDQVLPDDVMSCILDKTSPSRLLSQRYAQLIANDIINEMDMNCEYSYANLSNHLQDAGTIWLTTYLGRAIRLATMSKKRHYITIIKPGSDNLAVSQPGLGYPDNMLIMRVNYDKLSQEGYGPRKLLPCSKIDMFDEESINESRFIRETYQATRDN